MLHRRLAGIGWMAMAASIGVVASQQVRQPPLREEAGPRSAILGTVVDAASGQPVEGVRVQLSGSASRGSQTTYSDSDGRFAFANLGAGEVTLRASKAGYVTVWYGQKSPRAGRSGTAIALLAGQVIDDLSFPIPRGGVITGMVVDERNRPSVGTPVRVMRWSMTTGERTLVSAGSSATDDRGIYRVYGLPPGEYVVSAMPRNQLAMQSALSLELLAEMRLEAVNATVNYRLTAPDGVLAIQREAAEAALRREMPEQVEGYAPVYYPGSPTLGAASTMRLDVSEERAGVDFALTRTVLVRVQGTVAMPPNRNVSSVQLRLIDASARVPGVNTPSARAGRDGAFTFNAVPPGQYRLAAVATVRSSVRETGPPVAAGAVAATVIRTATTSRLWAMTDLVVGGSPIENVALFLQPAMTISGRLVYDGTAAPPAPGRRVRITLAPDDPMASAMGAPSVSGNVEPDGRFTLDGVLPVRYRLRSVSGASGWTLASAISGGRDVLDFPLDVQPDQRLPEIVVTMTDRTSALSGQLFDRVGRPTSDFSVIVFPADSRYWVPRSRRIASTRPTTNGQFNFGGLPPGNYRLAAVIDPEPGQWYDPEFLKQLLPASVATTLVEGQPTTQDLRVAGG